MKKMFQGSEGDKEAAQKDVKRAAEAVKEGDTQGATQDIKKAAQNTQEYTKKEANKAKRDTDRNLSKNHIVA